MDPRVRPLVLFVCTGNYYRSRFAERLFVAWSAARGLDWDADSRGLFETPCPGNVGFMSKYAVARLEELSVDVGARDRFPKRLEIEDLRSATRIVAMDESEHRVMFSARFPEWIERIDFWGVHDVDRTPARRALPAIEAKVSALVDALFDVTIGEAARLARWS